MSSPRNIWWSYVQGMMRRYPERAAALEAMRGVRMTGRYGAEPAGGKGPGRTTETVALRQLPPAEQREYEAVRESLAYAAEKPDGALRLKLVKLVYWDKTHKLYAAAWEVGVSERTARRWNRDILYRVAVNFGLVDEDWPLTAS